MRTITACLLLVSLSISVFTQSSASAPVTAFPGWTAPRSRDKAKTPFAPKPSTGDNIFKGEAERWLADSIVSISGSYLGTIADKEVSEYVAKLGKHLVTHSTNPTKNYEFHVLDDDTENAMTAGAGRIYINLGMLKSVENEDELAAVLAHEIAHDAFGHAPKTVTRQLFWMKGIRKVKTPDETEKALRDLLAAYEKNMFATVGESLLGWSRGDELQADKAGFYNMYKAGYNPECMKNVFRRFVKQTKEELGEDYNAVYFVTLLFGSHPPSSQRVTALKWESAWIKMPPKEERYKNAAFDAMKARVAKL